MTDDRPTPWPARLRAVLDSTQARLARLFRSPHARLASIVFVLALVLAGVPTLLWVASRPDTPDFYKPEAEPDAAIPSGALPTPPADADSGIELPPPPPPRVELEIPGFEPPVPDGASPTDDAPGIADRHDDAAPARESALERYRNPRPRYPIEALRRREEGEVLLRVLIGADGRPEEVDVLRSSRSRALDRAAVDTVRRWRFQPPEGGMPHEVQVPIEFRLDRP